VWTCRLGLNSINYVKVASKDKMFCLNKCDLKFGVNSNSIHRKTTDWTSVFLSSQLLVMTSSTAEWQHDIDARHSVAVFWDAGRYPARSDALTIVIKYGRRISTNSLSISVGTRSSKHNFVGDDMMMRRTSSLEHMSKLLKEELARSVDMSIRAQ